MIEKNVKTYFSPKVFKPAIDKTSFIHPLASVIGNVIIGKNVMVSPTACIRGNEGQSLFVDDDANVQDGVVLHEVETFSHGKPVEKRICDVNGKQYAVFVGKRVSLAHQAQIHGPACYCVIEPGAIVLGVTVAGGRYVKAGTVLTSQKDADKLPKITATYAFKDLNAGVIHVNTALAKACIAANKKKPAKTKNK